MIDEQTLRAMQIAQELGVKYRPGAAITATLADPFGGDITPAPTGIPASWGPSDPYLEAIISEGATHSPFANVLDYMGLLHPVKNAVQKIPIAGDLFAGLLEPAPQMAEIPIGFGKGMKDIMSFKNAGGQAMKNTGDITTTKTPTPEGGKSIAELAKDTWAAYDRMKTWLYENVDHWTWSFANDNPVAFIERYSDRIPAGKLAEAQRLLDLYKSTKDNRIKALERFQDKKDIKDFSKAELNEVISYADMNIATGWNKFNDLADNNTAEWIRRDAYGNIEIREFGSRKEAEVAGFDIGPVAPERIFFRQGPPPESGRSFNHMTNKPEDGVSVYVTPKAGSMAGMGRKGTYYGKGRQIGTGGDDEPVILITGKWRKFTQDLPNPSRPPESGGFNELVEKARRKK